jgi:putative ABC transport system permease protein
VSRWLALLIVRISARFVQRTWRARWREEWLAEIDTLPDRQGGLAYAAGAPWDAVSSRWTTKGYGFPRLWPSLGECRQAGRSLSRSPWFTGATIGVVALGIAFAATVFAVVDGVLFRPLPYPEPDRLFSVIEKAWPGNGLPETASPSPVQLDAWRDALPDVQVAAYVGLRIPNFILRSGPRAEELVRVMVGPGFWDTLGVAPMFGQFAPEDFTPQGRVHAAVISWDFWQRWFGGDPGAIGQSIVDDNGSGVRVVGVLPRRFTAPWGFRADIVTPLVSKPDSRDRGTPVLVRLLTGMSEQQVASRLSAINAALAPDWPVSSSPNPSLRHRSMPVGDVAMTPLRTVLTGESRTTSWLVLGMALSLVVLGCLNIAGLAAARVRDRWRDLMLRRALGGAALDLFRLLALEHTIVVMAGTVAGVVLASPLLQITVRLMPEQMRWLMAPAVDWRVVAFAAVVAAGAVFAITGFAGRDLRKDLPRITLADGRTTSRQGRWSGWTIVSAQVAVATVLVVGGSLVAGSLMRVWQEEPGLALADTGRIRVTPPRGATATEIEQLLGDLRRVPGVVAAGGAASSILNGVSFLGSDFDPPSHIPASPPGVAPGSIGVRLQSMRVTDGYLATTGLTLIDGRLPTAEEFATGAPVLVVSESVARGYWPDQQPIGQTLISNEFMRAPGRPFTVVGVVEDARYIALDRDAHGAIYYPNAAGGTPWLGTVLVRLDTNGTTSLGDVGAWMQTRCPRCTIYGAPTPLDELIAASIRPRTFHAWLFTSFAVAALSVAGAGILGLVAMVSSRRTKEIGIRLALGATPAGITWQMVREQTVAVAAGLIAGGLAAVWAVRFVESYLYKLPMYDASTWAVAIGLLLVVSILGAAVPSALASRLDPLQALREE